MLNMHLSRLNILQVHLLSLKQNSIRSLLKNKKQFIMMQNHTNRND